MNISECMYLYMYVYLFVFNYNHNIITSVNDFFNIINIQTMLKYFQLSLGVFFNGLLFELRSRWCLYIVTSCYIFLFSFYILVSFPSLLLLAIFLFPYLSPSLFPSLSLSFSLVWLLKKPSSWFFLWSRYSPHSACILMVSFNVFIHPHYFL